MNSEIDLWFSPDGEAVIGYVLRFKTRIVAGAPVCEAGRLAEIADIFESEAMRHGETVCWFSATSRLKDALARKGHHSSLLIGAQPVWNPQRWKSIVSKNASLRAQLNRATNRGVEVSEWDESRAIGHDGLRQRLKEWLGGKSLPPLGFLTEPVILDDLQDRRIFVAERRAQGDIVQAGYLVLTPAPLRNGWLVEQIVRGDAAPNGVSELLIDFAMRALAEEGYEYLTLGLAPLSTKCPSLPQPLSQPSQFWLRSALSWVRAHGKRFYNFEGIDAFKSKLKPEEWEPLFALSNEPGWSLRTLFAIFAAFIGGDFLRDFARIVASSLAQEARSLKHRLFNLRP